ncbi:hypothetical protein JHC09_10145 [Devosia sp. MC532]|uniref:hypothetical protein n=1 Tax=Devosia sp. MC532 TaxID=2799788 RepID=UPI0018F44B28|nr:hypothetical protein [Devosia sp. MC532]MBJ7578247.1 hypothetical protein [Devosia sp. MC532]
MGPPNRQQLKHTVPVKVLTDRWKAFRAERAPMLVDVYAWTLVHSVSAGVHMSEKGGLGPYEKKTDAFTADHAHVGLPFMRYSYHAAPPVIWNVMTGERVESARWTFRDHVESIEALLREVCGDQSEVVQLRARMQELLTILPGGGA